MIKRLCTIILFSLPLPVWGQVIVPSLDQGLPVELASAVAWRVGSIAGVDTELYYQQEDDASNDAGGEHVRSSALLVYQPGNLVGELVYTPKVKQPSSVEENGSSVSWEDNNGSGLALRVAIRGNRRVSVGLGYERYQYDYQYNGETGEESESAVTSLYEGSFSLRLLEGLIYTGGGLQRVTLDLGSEDTIKYNRTLGGVAFQLGDPLGMMFQTEAALKLTPETTSENGVIVSIPKTTESQLTAEFITGTFFLAYKYRQTVYENVSEDENKTQVNNRYGAGIRLGGFIFGLYRNAWKSEFMDETLVYDTYQLTASYNLL